MHKDVLLMMLSACLATFNCACRAVPQQPTVTPTSTRKPTATPSSEPTHTCTPSSTPVPTYTPTATFTPSPTPQPTPTPEPIPLEALEKITPSNAHQLKLLAKMGRPSIGYDGARITEGTVVVQTRDGFEVFDLNPIRERCFANKLGEGSSYRAIAVSPDGETVALGHPSGSVSLWAAGGCAMLDSLDTERPRDLLFSSDGSLLIVNGTEGVSAWNLHTGQRQRQLISWTAREIALNQGNTILATGNSSGSVDLWDLETGEKIGTLVYPGMKGVVSDLAFSPDGSTLAVGLWGSRNAVIYDLETREAVEVVQCESPVRDVAFSQDGSQLAVAADSTYVWRVGQNEEPIRMRAGQGVFGCPSAMSVAFVDNDQKLVSVSDGSFIVWDTAGLQPVEKATYGAFPASDLRFSAGSRLTAAMKDRIATIDVERQSVVQSLDYRSDHRALAEDRPIAALERDGVVSVVDLTTDRLLSTLHDDIDVDGLSISPEGEFVATFTEGNNATRNNVVPGHLKLWSVAKGNALFDSGGLVGVQVSDVAVAPSGALMGVAEGFGYSASIWNNKGLVRTIGNMDVFKETGETVQFDPGGDLVALGDYGGSVYIGRVHSGVIRRVVAGSQAATTKRGTWAGNMVFDIAFPSKGDLLAAVTAIDGRGHIQLIDLRNSREIAIQEVSSAYALSVAFSEDQRILASSHRDGFISFWGVPVE